MASLSDHYSHGLSRNRVEVEIIVGQELFFFLFIKEAWGLSILDSQTNTAKMFDNDPHAHEYGYEITRDDGNFKVRLSNPIVREESVLTV